MNQVAQEKRDHEWLDYYEQFHYFSPQKVRDSCHPRIMEHPESAKAIVLVHGLTDSPYFMSAIGEFFHDTLGHNVYMPLLHCHGLKEPKGMEGVKLEEWKANVSFAIESAASKAEQISIGGLSTGGTLSFYMAATNKKINGTLYLFSAALDLAGGCLGLIGEVKERLLRTFLADVLDKNKPLIGANPYRYSRMDMDGAQELARLIKETDAIMDKYSQKDPFPVRVFAAHSECDTTADIAGIERLEKRSIPDSFHFFRIPKKAGVPHASVVLNESISVNGELLENRNPLFPQMLDAIADFV
ncbi:MAG: alpha/beta hydrolase [Candidatus Hodarchaeota archaeon]